MKLENYRLSPGKHTSPSEGMCVMELVSYVAMEKWSDAPKCTSQVIAAYCRGLNDKLNAQDRQKLLPYIHRLVGLRNDAVEERLLFLCADRAVRVFAPKALRKVGMAREAEMLAGLAPIEDSASADAASCAATYAAYGAARAARCAAAYATCATNAAAYATCATNAAADATCATNAAAYGATCAASCAATCGARTEGFALLDEMIEIVKASLGEDQEEEVVTRIAHLPELVPA